MRRGAAIDALAPHSLPSSPPVLPIVPQARPDRVYDIKYWPRDARRAGQLVGGTNQRFVDVVQYDVTAKDDALTVREGVGVEAGLTAVPATR